MTFLVADYHCKRPMFVNILAHVHVSCHHFAGGIIQLKSPLFSTVQLTDLLYGRLQDKYVPL